MNEHPERLSLDAWRRMHKAGAPYQQILEEEPLWVATHVDPRGAKLLLVHADKMCGGWPSLSSNPPVLDPQLRLFKKRHPPALILCSCTIRHDNNSIDNLWMHPLRRAQQFASNLTQVMSQPLDCTPTLVRHAEIDLHLLCRGGCAALAQPATPGLASWADWLRRQMAAAVHHVDEMRVHQQQLNQVRPGPDDVFALIDILSPQAEHAAHELLATACPIQIRFVADSMYVVRAPIEIAAGVLPMSGPAIVILGPVRPMSTDTWQLFEKLVITAYEPVAAYGAAADSLTRLDSDTRQLLDPLIAAGVPASELVSIAAELAQ